MGVKIENIRKAEQIGNYYGTLNIKEECGKYYWAIEGYSGFEWQEITKELYDAINKFLDEAQNEL